jgi:hypothetical protein
MLEITARARGQQATSTTNFKDSMPFEPMKQGRLYAAVYDLEEGLLQGSETNPDLLQSFFEFDPRSGLLSFASQLTLRPSEVELPRDSTTEVLLVGVPELQVDQKTESGGEATEGLLLAATIRLRYSGDPASAQFEGIVWKNLPEHIAKSANDEEGIWPSARLESLNGDRVSEIETEYAGADPGTGAVFLRAKIHESADPQAPFVRLRVKLCAPSPLNQRSGYQCRGIAGSDTILLEP